jgi:hypothetical protein
LVLTGIENIFDKESVVSLYVLVVFSLMFKSAELFLARAYAVRSSSASIRFKFAFGFWRRKYAGMNE